MEKHGVVCVRYVRIEDRALDDPSGSWAVWLTRRTGSIARRTARRQPGKLQARPYFALFCCFSTRRKEMSEQTRHATPNLLISIHILWLLISSLLHSLLLSLFPLQAPPLLTPGISPTYVLPSPSTLLPLPFSTSLSTSPVEFEFPSYACVQSETGEGAGGKREDFSFLCARDSRVARSTDYLRPSLWGVTYYYLPLT